MYYINANEINDEKYTFKTIILKLKLCISTTCFYLHTLVAVYLRQGNTQVL
jgi:hypothetical protein